MEDKTKKDLVQEAYEERQADEQSSQASLLEELDISKQASKEHVDEKEYEINQKVRQVIDGHISDLAGLMERSAVAGSYDSEFIDGEKKKDKKFRDLLKLIDRINEDQQRLNEINKEIAELKDKIHDVKEQFKEEYGDDWPDKVAEKYGVTRKNGETQADYERRILEAADKAGNETAAGVTQDYADLDEKYREKAEIVARLERGHVELEKRSGELSQQLILLNEARDSWAQINENPNLEDRATAQKAWHKEFSDLKIDENANPEDISANLKQREHSLLAQAQEVSSDLKENQYLLDTNQKANVVEDFDEALVDDIDFEIEQTSVIVSAANDVELGQDTSKLKSLKPMFNPAAAQMAPIPHNAHNLTSDIPNPSR